MFAEDQPLAIRHGSQYANKYEDSDESVPRAEILHHSMHAVRNSDDLNITRVLQTGLFNVEGTAQF